MIPSVDSGEIQAERVPRMRGDDPMSTAAGDYAALVFPACAGMIP